MVLQIYENGSVYPAHVLDITQDDLLKKFMAGVGRLTALSLAINHPSELTLGHSLALGWRKLAGLALATDYKFPQLDALLKSAASAPAKSAAAPAAAAAAGGGGGKAGGGKKPEPKPKEPEPEPEPDDGPGLGSIFD